MPDDRPTISSSRLSAGDVARHAFGNVRRGFDPHEVRAFLESVSRELLAWEQREHELRAELAEAEERARHPVLEESMISAALGQQSAKVLRSAHEEAARIVAAAEEAAATMAHQAQRQATEVQVGAEAVAAERIAEAELATGSIRQDIDRVAAGMMEEARAESEEVLARAREQGRALVERAQLARREVLADLVQRRRELHIQIEQFRAARDELAAAVLGVRGSVDGIVADLARVDEDARTAAARVARQPPPDLGALTVDELDRLTEEGGAGPGEPVEAAVAEEPAAEGAVAGEAAAMGAAVGAAMGAIAEGGAETPAAGIPAVAEEGHEVPEDQGGAMPGDSEQVADLASAEARETASVEDLFARIRAGHDDEPAGPVPPATGVAEPIEGGVATGEAPTEVPTEDGSEGTPAMSGRRARRSGSEWLGTSGRDGVDDEVVDEQAVDEQAVDEQAVGGEGGAVEVEGEVDGDDAVLLRQRADLLDPVTVRLTRRLKRALQDDQNRLLARIRSGSGRWTDDVLIPEHEQQAQLVEASNRLLKEAYAAGATFARERVQPGGRPARPSRAADKLAAADAQARAEEISATVVSQLRRRLSAGGGDAPAGGPDDDAAERVGAAYREWRGERIERLVGDAAVGAFSAGVLSAVGSGGSLRWLPADREAACPDCDDNSLADAVTVGGEFPTGHAHPPAHPGCRCLVAPTPA